MAIRLVGELLSPISCPLANVTIHLKALDTSASVLFSSEASVKTDYRGRYEFTVPTGLYLVSLDNGISQAELGQIQVYSDSTESTLQALLDAPQTEPSPVWLQQLEEKLAEATRQAGLAAQSASEAADTAKTVTETADAAKQHADRAYASSTSASQSKLDAEDAATRAELAASSVPEIAQAAVDKITDVADKTNIAINDATDAAQSAEASANKAKAEADRAKTEADRASAITGLNTVEDALDSVTKDLITLNVAGSGCVDDPSISSSPTSNFGAIVFSSSQTVFTLNQSRYVFGTRVIDVPKRDVSLTPIAPTLSRKDFVYVTSGREAIVLDGTDDSSDPKTAFSKIGFAPVSGDPLLYKKGEVYALAIGFIQRVGDTYFSSKLPSAAPKIEPKLIDCWFDLRLSAHRQDVNLLREKAIRCAVAGELRGKGNACFSDFSKHNILKTGDHPDAYKGYDLVKFSRVAIFTNDITIPIGSKLLVSDGTNWFRIISGMPQGSYIYCDKATLINCGMPPTGHELDLNLIIEHDLAEFDTVPWVDIIGAPSVLAQTFPNGCLGLWAGNKPEGGSHPLSRKAMPFSHRLITKDNGATWSALSSGFNEVMNTAYVEPNENTVSLYQYETMSKFTEKADNSEVIGSVGDVSAIIWHGNQFGARLASSTIDRILKNSNINAGVHDILSKVQYNIFNNALVPSNSWGRTSDMKHSQLSFGTPTDPCGVKALSTITEKNGLLYLQLHGCELVHNGTSWGDDSIVPIISGEGTKADKNGNTVKTFCHHSLFPIGIADSQTLASLKIDNRANISDDINSGLHFDCLEDVPSPIRDFYYEIEDELGLIRVYKYPHPHESGGHISDENIQLWQFHDDFKEWLQTCAEIKFNAAQEGEESERVPLPPMPIKENYVGK